MLKPGGVFVSSTACLGDTMKFFELIAPIGKFLGLMPLVKVFTMQQLRDSLTGAGFRDRSRLAAGQGSGAVYRGEEGRIATV